MSFASIWGKVFFEFELDGSRASEVAARNPQPFVVYKMAESLDQRLHHLIIVDEFDRVRDQEAKTLMADTINYFSDYPLSVTILIVGVGQIRARQPTLRTGDEQLHTSYSPECRKCGSKPTLRFAIAAPAPTIAITYKRSMGSAYRPAQFRPDTVTRWPNRRHASQRRGRASSAVSPCPARISAARSSGAPWLQCTQ